MAADGEKHFQQCGWLIWLLQWFHFTCCNYATFSTVPKLVTMSYLLYQWMIPLIFWNITLAENLLLFTKCGKSRKTTRNNVADWWCSCDTNMWQSPKTSIPAARDRATAFDSRKDNHYLELISYKSKILLFASHCEQEIRRSHLYLF